MKDFIDFRRKVCDATVQSVYEREVWGAGTGGGCGSRGWGICTRHVYVAMALEGIVQACLDSMISPVADGSGFLDAIGSVWSLVVSMDK